VILAELEQVLQVYATESQFPSVGGSTLTLPKAFDTEYGSMVPADVSW
jgi:hypothetical protein